MERKFDLEKCRTSIRDKTRGIEERLKRLGLNWKDLGSDLIPETVLGSKKPLIFLGPSLPLEKAISLLDADFWPPIARDDLMRALEEGYRVIGIVDGVFHQSLTVSIEEIRFALESGAVLYGASSMGALRAAETYPLGMQGVGTVYRWYREETVDCDDEVAVSFDGATGKSLTEPAVNLRATLARLESEGKIDRERSKLLLENYLKLHFSRRNLVNLFQSLEGKISGEDRRILEEGWVNQKALDAVELLQTIRQKHVATPA